MKTNEKNIIQLDLANLDIKILKALSAEPTIRANQEMSQTLAKELKSRINENGNNGDICTCIANIVPYLEDAELMQSFIGNGADVAIARHCKDCQTLRELLISCKSNEKVIAEISANEFADDAIIRTIVSEFYYMTSVYYKLLTRRNLSEDVMSTIACHPTEEVKICLSKYQDATIAILWMLLKNSTSRRVRLNIAEHPNASVDILKKILNCELEKDSPDREILTAIAKNNNVNDEILLDSIKFLRDNLKEVLENSNVSSNVLAYICDEMHEYGVLERYSETPAEILRQILHLEEDKKSHAWQIVRHRNSDEQILQEIAERFGKDSNMLQSVIFHHNVTKKVLDFTIFEVLGTDYWRNYERYDVRKGLLEGAYYVRAKFVTL